MAEQTLKEKTAKGLFWGGISNGVQQLLAVIIGIVLLKNLTPDDYGMVGMLAIFTGIANTIQESGFTAALTNRPEFKAEDYNSVFWFNLIVGSTIYFILFFCAPLIAYFYGEDELIPLSRILFLSIILGSLGTAQNAVLFRFLMVKERAKIDIFSTIISGVIGVLLAVFGFGYWALVFQMLIYAFSGTALRWFFSPWKPEFSFDITPVKEMFSFSFKMLLSSIIAQIHGNIFSVLLGKFDTKTDVGYFSQGAKWSGMGSQFIAGMVASVAQPIFVNAKKDLEFQISIFRKLLRFTVFVSFPLLLGLGFVCEDFILLLNSKWLPSIPILQLYCIWGSFMPITVLCTQVIITYNRSDLFFKSTVIYAVFQISIAALTLSYGMYWMAFSLTMSSLFFLLFWYIMLRKVLVIPFKCIILDIGPYLIFSLFVLFVTWLFTNGIELILLRLLSKIIISILLYVGLLYLSGSIMLKDSINFFLKRI